MRRRGARRGRPTQGRPRREEWGAQAAGLRKGGHPSPPKIRRTLASLITLPMPPGSPPPCQGRRPAARTSPAAVTPPATEKSALTWHSPLPGGAGSPRPPPGALAPPDSRSLARVSTTVPGRPPRSRRRRALPGPRLCAPPPPLAPAPCTAPPRAPSPPAAPRPTYPRGALRPRTHRPARPPNAERAPGLPGQPRGELRAAASAGTLRLRVRSESGTTRGNPHPPPLSTEKR